ncbi:hypothetical protein BC332_26264 [Capsicum chinense]|nr:hypothetical protein BC332_26264 [Capsicum chinense]
MLNCKPSPMPMNMNEKMVLDDGTGATNDSNFRYLVGGLNYLSHIRPHIAFYVRLVSSDWIGSLENFTRTSGNVFSLGFGAISWNLRKQDAIALSSSKAEYMATSFAHCQAIWLRKLLVNLQKERIGPTKIWCDNNVSIAMTNNPAFHSRMKHIDIHYHFIRNLVVGGIISLKFCGTNDPVVDVLRKSLPQKKHEFFRL